jgi:lipoprotein-anchoring transpeptidase ErfK/SrfK
MTRVTRTCALLLILLGVILPFRSGSSATAQASGGLKVQATLLQTHTIEGGKAALFVHTGARASLTLTVHYAANVIGTYHAAADAHGRYVFAWKVPLGLDLKGNASLSLVARRGTLQTQWSGTLSVQGAPLPALFVHALQPRFVAGTLVGIFVSTAPNAAFTYVLRSDDGAEIANGSGVADGSGRYTINVLDTILPKHDLGVIATVQVANQAGTRSRTARFVLTPRPAMPLFVKTAAKSVLTGNSIDLFVSTRPGARIMVTMAVTSTVVVTATGVADKSGRWVYSARLQVPLKTAHSTQVQVRATSGIDSAAGVASFILKPNPNGLGGIDRLATAIDPSPNLSKYFSVVPDKVIMVSTEGQVLREYDHGVLVHENYVTTGRPELPTVHGIFHVYLKQTPFEFISPWPAGSPFYYAPSWVRYWMPFIGGYGLHDAPWRKVYGPGTNLPHYSTDPGEPVGSHGCVNIPLQDMIWLWNWAEVGTTVVVY